MEKKKRILLTSPGALNNGGVQFVLMTIVRNLSQNYIFDILTFNSHQNYYQKEFLSYGGKIVCFERKEYSNLFKRTFYKLFFNCKLKRFLTRLFKVNDYYAIHCNSQFTSCYILKYAKKHGINKRICHSHSTYRYTDFIREIFRNHYRRMINNNASILLGCSNIACNTFYHLKDGYHVVNNPYDNINISFNKDTPATLTLLHIGMFCQNKNQTFSIKVLYYLRKLYPNAKLRLVGTGDPQALKNLVNELHLNDNVVFYKHNEDKMFLFKNSNYFLMPSFSEGFGITLIEAQAAGLYCFASDSITTDTNCGGVFYCSLNAGPEEWAKKIYTFYMSNKGQKSLFCCKNYSINSFIKNITDYYNS